MLPMKLSHPTIRKLQKRAFSALLVVVLAVVSCGRQEARGIADSRSDYRDFLPMKADPAKCKHPSVRVVAREEDSEFVECLECSEVFESSEFKDMDVEDSKLEEL